MKYKVNSDDLFKIVPIIAGNIWVVAFLLAPADNIENKTVLLIGAFVWMVMHVVVIVEERKEKEDGE